MASTTTAAASRKIAARQWQPEHIWKAFLAVCSTTAAATVACLDSREHMLQI